MTEAEMIYELEAGESITEGIITAVSEFSDTDPIPSFADERRGESLEPLYHAIDPDALEALLDRDRSSREIEVSFQYMGYNITATSGGEIGISRPGIAFC